MSANTQVTEARENLRLLASIYSYEISDSIAIREFVESYGCDSLINTATDLHIDYLIICGEPEYVKSILSLYPKFMNPILLIVWNVDDAQHLMSELTNIKVVVTDEPPFDASLIKRIFTFFFISHDTSLHLATGKPSRRIPQKRDIPEQTRMEVPIEIPRPKYFDRSRANPPQTIRYEKALGEDDRQRISETIANVFASADTGNATKPVDRKQTTGRWKMSSAFLLFPIICCVPIIVYITSLMIALSSLFFSGLQLSEGNIDVSRQIVTISRYWTQQSRGVLTGVGAPFRLFRLPHIFRSQERVLSFLTDSQDALTATQDVVRTGKEFSKTIASQLYGSEGTGISPAQLVSTMQVQLPYIQDRLALASAELGTLTEEHAFPFSYTPVKTKALAVKHMLDTSRSNIAVIDGLVSVYATAGGFDARKTYLVLLQNSMELRPGGGFIGSIAKVVVHDGIIESLEIQDVYAIDGQLKGHVDPPKPVQELLGQEHWYLRDSNWEPDFTVSAKTAAWFYGKETNTNVDGVFAISTPVLVDLLRVTGPITLSEYNDQITADNFFGKSLYYVQHDFFPGSTQKKDFLGTLTSAIITRITQDKSVNAIPLFQAIQSGLVRHDIQMAFQDAALMRLVSHNGWSGQSVIQRLCQVSSITPCIGDFIYPIEANMSMNKVNAFITRKRTTEIVINDTGEVTTSLSIIYENTSDGSAGSGGGNYKEYMRFQIPANSTGVAITFDGQPVPVRNIKEKQLPVSPYTDASFMTTEVDGQQTMMVPVVLDVPVKSTRHLNIRYSHPLPVLTTGQSYIYEYLQPKQAGISKTVMETRIRLPSDWNPVPQKEPDRRALLANQIQLEYNSLLAQDDSIRVLITKP